MTKEKEGGKMKGEERNERKGGRGRLGRRKKNQSSKLIQFISKAAYKRQPETIRSSPSNHQP